MRKVSECMLVSCLAMVLVVGFTGCGKSEYESADDFLNSIDTEADSGVPMEATVPPVDTEVDPDKLAKIRLETEELDMGLIAYNELAHKKLMVYNDGGMPLKITRVDTTCACTQGEVTPENAVIQPGKSSWIDVVVDPRRIPGFHSHKVLTITSTDPKRLTVEVGVSVDVDPEFEIDSSEIDLGDVEKGVPFEKRIRFRQLIEDTVTIKSLEPFVPGLLQLADPGFTTEVVPVPEADWKVAGRHEFDLVFKFGPDLAPGPFSRYANLHTDINRVNRMRIVFTGTVIAPYEVTPIYPVHAELRHVPGDHAYKGLIKFSSATPITLKVLDTGNPDLAAVVAPAPTPTEAMIDVSYTGADPVAGDVFNEIVTVEVQANGGVYTEKVGVYINPAPGAGAQLGHEGHQH